jgi:hypothetical protein
METIKKEEFEAGARIGTFYGFIFGMLFACFEIWIINLFI